MPLVGEAWLNYFRIADYTLGTSVEATLGGERDTGKCKTSPSRKG